MTYEEFSPVFGKLAMALQWHSADEAVARTYHEVLAAFDVAPVAEAARHLCQEADRRFPPTSAEWHGRARLAALSQPLLALPHREDPWRVDCPRCDDTCWEPLACDGSTQVVVSCGRKTPHAAHGYVVRCRCWPDNPTWRRHGRSTGGTR